MITSDIHPRKTVGRMTLEELLEEFAIDYKRDHQGVVQRLCVIAISSRLGLGDIKEATPKIIQMYPEYFL